MREILFRGKRCDNGEWVEGFLLKECNYATCSWNLAIEFKTDRFGKFAYDVAEIIPKTVGQFTGLTANGKKIFEGDIVEGHCHSQWRHDVQRCVVAYGRDGFECRHHIGGLDTDYYTYRVLFSKDVVVIGNIHDNPELIGGAEE